MRARNSAIVLFSGATACVGERGESGSDAAVDAGDPYLLLDSLPFGVHPARAMAVAGNPYGLATSAGVAWTRGGEQPYLFWSLVDPDRTGDPARMGFSGTLVDSQGNSVPFDYDKGIADALDAGLSVLWNVAVEPSPGTYSKQGSWLPVNETAYKSFVDTTVRRYPAVRAWQVGNEPNGGSSRGLSGFADLYRLTFDAAKGADPGVVVVMGGVAGNGSARDKMDTYFDAVLDQLAGHPIDVFDFHFFGDPRGGKLMINSDQLLGYGEIEEVASFCRARLDSRGFSSTRLWSTENGTPSGTWHLGPGTFTTTEAEQARDLVKRFVVAMASGVDKVFWAWGMTEGLGPWDDDFFDHTGLVYSGHGAPVGTPKLVYWAYWKLTREAATCDWRRVARVATTVSATRAYRCPLSGGSDVVIAWWDTFDVAGYDAGQAVELTVPWDAASAIQRAAVPSVSSGAQVQNPSTAFAAVARQPDGGSVVLVLGQDPVFVRAE